MSFDCNICATNNTASGTEHALYSTKCGHLFGKSCLEEWIRRSSRENRFRCPVCRMHLNYSGCHPIFNAPIELSKSKFGNSKGKHLSENDIVKDYLSGRLKKGSTFFIETGIGRTHKKFIKFFDVHDGYILISAFYCSGVGNIDHDGDTCLHKYFIQIFKGTNILYSEDSGSVPVTAVAFNKFREDAIEFCVGFKDGCLMTEVLSPPYENLRIQNKRGLIKEDSKINSICFLGKEKVVFSVGKCNIFTVFTDNASDKENWLTNVNVELKAVTNLAVINDCVLFGIMEGKIYVFEKNKIPYVLFSEEDTQVTNYTYDSVTNMISIVNSLPYYFIDDREGYMDEIWDEKIVSHKMFIVSKIPKFDSEGCRRETYDINSVGDFPDSSSQVVHEFNPTIISVKYCGRCFAYSIVPNVENGTLQVHFVNDALNIVGRKKIDNLGECIGIFRFEKPVLLLSNVLKIPIVLIFHHGFKTLNFYSLL
uniref:RING-type domain-containing protein n=1 Tax=Strongyloides papillosus TaxID=174720 RepID=A0A0N5BY51_STREA